MAFHPAGQDVAVIVVVAVIVHRNVPHLRSEITECFLASFYANVILRLFIGSHFEFR